MTNEDSSSIEETLLVNEIQNDEGIRKPATWKLLPVAGIVMAVTAQVAASITGIQASWFRECEHSNHNDTLSNFLATGDGLPCHMVPGYETGQAVSGTVHSIQNLLCFVTSAFIGKLSDSFGRNSILSIVCVFGIIPALVLAVANSPLFFYLSLIVSGLFGVGNSGGVLGSLLSAYICDAYPSLERSKQIGRLMAALSFVTMLTPLIGNLVSRLSNEVIVAILYASCVFVFLYSNFLLPISLPLNRRKKLQVLQALNLLGPFRLLKKSRLILWICITYLPQSLGMSGLNEVLFTYIDERFMLENEAATRFNTLVLSSNAVSAMLVFFFMPGILLKKYKWRPSSLLILSQLSALISTFMLCFLGLIKSRLLVFIISVPIGVSSLGLVATNGLVSLAASEYEQGIALGTLGAVLSLSRSISPVLFSFIFKYAGKEYDSPEITFLFVAGLVIVSLISNLLGPLRKLELEIMSKHS